MRGKLKCIWHILWATYYHVYTDGWVRPSHFRVVDGEALIRHLKEKVEETNAQDEAVDLVKQLIK